MHRIQGAINRLKQAVIKQINKLKQESTLSYLLAIFPRVLFLIHAVFAIRFLRNLIRAIDGGKTLNTSPLYIGIILLFVETIYTIMARRGHENKHIWFSGFLYLTTLVPTIWLMELNFFERRQASRDSIVTTNTTIAADTTENQIDSLKYWNCIKDTAECDVQFVKNYSELGLIAVIIIGRWMLPRGDLTRDQLSALLISYINVAADLTEFIGFHSKLDGMMYSYEVTVTILSVYSVSLLQFIIVTTSTTYEYNEHEKLTIERITNTPHYRNLPLYLRPHARKLRRSSISRNIDKMAVQSFAKGKRAGRRRTAIFNDRQGHVKSSLENQNSMAKRIQVNTEMKMTMDTDANCGVKYVQMFGNFEKQSRKRNENGDFVEEGNEPEEQSRTKRNAKALERWVADARVSRRIKRFRRLVVEENWIELADAIVEMKSASKRHKTEVSDDSLNGLFKPLQEDIKISRWKKLIEVAQSDIGAIMIALLFQECPFLVTRVVFMYQFQVSNRGLVFYTIKNMLMLTFLSYKLWVSANE